MIEVVAHLCECGCGQPTRPAAYTDKRRELVKGQPTRFLKSHNHHWALRHGHTRGGWSPTYTAWRNMLARCSDKNPDYARYAGRDIGIDDPRWFVFDNFLADMGEKPEGLTLHRVDNDKGYCETNCRWATPKEQANERKQPYSERTHCKYGHPLDRVLRSHGKIVGRGCLTCHREREMERSRRQFVCE